MTKFSSLIFLLLLLPFASFSQGQGKPFLKNYPPKVYDGHAQNWAIAQDQRGVMYVGNGNGVMEYDGSEWRMIELPNETTARSMVVSDNKIVYVGTSDNFGYMSVDESGNSTFISLRHHLPDSVQGKVADVWETQVDGNTIYFRTYYYLFRYENGKLDYFPSEERNRFFSSFVFKNQFYIEESNRKVRKIKRLEGNKLVLLEDNDGFARKSISVSFSYKEDTVILSGRRGGLYKYPFSPNAEEESKTLFAQADSIIRKNIVYTSASKYNDGYALGTFQKGVMLLDKNFRFTGFINQAQNSLVTDNIYSIFFDRDQALWMGGANGVARIDLASDVSYWNQDSGLQGTVSWIERFEEKLYVATSSAAYVFEGNEIQPISRSVGGQNWHLLKFTNPENSDDKKLLLSTGLVWEIEGNKSRPVMQIPNSVAAIFKMYQDKLDPYRVWLAMSDGLSSMRFDTKDEKGKELEKGRWVYEGKIEGAEGNNRSVARDEDGNLWIGTFRNGIIRLIPKKGEERAFDIKKYSEEQGVLSGKNVIIFETSEGVLFGTDKGICMYDATEDKFVPFKKFGEEYYNGKRDVFSLQENVDGNIWISGLFNQSSPAVVAEKQTDGSFKINNNPFKKVPPMMALAMTVEPNGTAWLGGSEGVFRYQKNQSNANGEKEYYAIIRKVVIGGDSILFGGNYVETILDSIKIATLKQPKGKTANLSAEYNSVDFHFSSPFFDNESETQYKFYLEKFEYGWSAWEKRSVKEYTNLPGGTYTFHVKAKNLYGTESIEATYTFEIQSPWYLRWWAFILYLILAGVIIYGFVKWNERRLKIENERLEGVIMERTSEIRKQTEELTFKNAELNQQKEEIQAQAENLRELNEEISAVNNDLNGKTDALQKANADIQNLTLIGKAITSTLDIREVINIVYKNVNNLMDASGFGIGIFQPSENALEFKGYMEKGEALPDHTETMKRKAVSLANKVFNSGEVYFSNDIEDDFAKEGKVIDVVEGEIPLSVIYIPLVYGKEKVGVITVQSFERNAYSKNDLNILETLASYATIALANARGYEIIRSKNKHITDSIRYSKTMQTAFLPSEKALKDVFSDHFLVYKPRDIVSGDFYWMSHLPEQNKLFIAVVDCTGHGVPGSFMSIVGATLLNEIVNLQGVLEPSQILEDLNTGIISTLSQDEKQSNDDGMDVCLCMIEKTDEGAKVTFSGAKRDLYFINQGERTLQSLSGDRKLIGGRQKGNKVFTNKVLELETGATIYLTTDGMVDQHNEERRKFGSLYLKSLLSEISDHSMDRQGEIIDGIFDKYRGDMEQRDDVTLLGIKI
jgi:serine phosphatase RsbU (regulator of sigma subunit)/ligand-binding sensor domain-containing protein